MSNLPPGCSGRDIEEAAGAIVRCAGCEKSFDPEQLENELCVKCEEENEE